MKNAFSSIAKTVLESSSARLFLILCSVWLCISAGIRPLTLPDEGRYIGIAWEMLNSDNWLVPTLDGLPFFHKPPLFYWLTALGLKLFGVNEWAGRLASILAALMASAALYVFIRRHVSNQVANLALAILITQPFFFVGAQFANLDMLVAGMISLTILFGASAVLALERGLPYKAALTTAYVFAVLGVLAKGLIGFVLPGAILFAWLVIGRRFRLIPSLLPIHLVLLFFALVAPWFWWMEKSYPGFWNYFFVYHHFQRFAETGFNNQQAFWFYLPVLILFTLPWSPWIFRVFNRNFLQDKERFAIRSLMIVWLMGILVFFSLPSSKLVGYILPALPPFAFLIADVMLVWLSAAEKRNSSTASAWLGVSLIVASTACIAIVLAVTHLDPTSSRKMSALALPVFQAEDQIVMLDEYQYDMPFYLKATKPSWVISDWKSPEIPKKDNWRKELYDAGKFDPARMQQVLFLPGEFAPKLCQFSGAALWVWGKMEVISSYPFLKDERMVYTNGKKALLRLDVTSRRKLTICSGMPSNG